MLMSDVRFRRRKLTACIVLLDVLAEHSASSGGDNTGTLFTLHKMGKPALWMFYTQRFTD